MTVLFNVFFFYSLFVIPASVNEWQVCLGKFLKNDFMMHQLCHFQKPSTCVFYMVVNVTHGVLHMLFPGFNTGLVFHTTI